MELRKTLTVEAKLHEQLRVMSKKTGMRIAALVDQALMAYLTACLKANKPFGEELPPGLRRNRRGAV
jgi:Ribbon-helix-helix domain